MQLSATARKHRTTTVAGLVNHTPHPFETTILLVPPEAESSDMVSSSAPSLSGIPLTAGPFYTNAFLGQPQALPQARSARLLPGQQETLSRSRGESEATSITDDFSIHYVSTDQAPYVTETRHSSPLQPRDNKPQDVKQLVKFLNQTAPVPPHRRPSKLSQSSRGEPSKKAAAIRFFKTRQKRSVPEPPEINDVGGLLPLPPQRPPRALASVEQKVSSTGKRYCAIKPPEEYGMEMTPLSMNEQVDVGSVLRWSSGPADYDAQMDVPPALSPSIVDSHVSISFPESINSFEKLEMNWRYDENIDYLTHSPSIRHPGDNMLTDDTIARAAAPYLERSVSPIRPSASSPLTPEPQSAVSAADTYISDFTEHLAKDSLDISRALTSHPVRNATASSLPLPEISLPYEECPVRHPGRNKDMQIKHQSPRRLASHTVLMQRASSLGSALNRRSFTDSPGPPPRSLLRPRLGAETIENILDSYREREGTSTRTAPSIMDVNDFLREPQPMKGKVVTECTGPIKRPKSRGKPSASYHFLRRDREERTRARKLRDRPTGGVMDASIDAVVNVVAEMPRQKLRKVRPQIQIPAMRPAPLLPRPTSTASSGASWRKVTESTRDPTSAGPSERTPTTAGEKTGYTPISPTTSRGSTAAEMSMALSPVMLVAEQIPVPKTKPTPRPANIVVKEGKVYSPRPRSASIPRSAMKRRSRPGSQATTRRNSPAPTPQDENTPPLPSPPPNRQLPPTPPASGSEKTAKIKSARIADADKDLPAIPTSALARSSHKRSEQQLPHIATQRKPRDRNDPKVIQARLAELEKQNKLLSAALEAVIRTNGNLNGPLGESGDGGSLALLSTWQNRIARRSAASHAASSSKGSALDMYMTTRHGSQRGC